MADYYPLIARAIAGLDPNAPGESRRALYERARTALIAQLRSVQPPLSDRKSPASGCRWKRPYERSKSEAAQRAREASRPAGAGGPPPAAATLSAAPMLPVRRNPQTLQARRPVRSAPRPPSQPPSRETRPPRPAPRRLARTNLARRAICAPMRRRPARRARSRRTFRCRIPGLPPPPSRRRSSPRPRKRPAAPPRPACAVFATSPPTPTISAVPRRRPIAMRERPMPTCRRPRGIRPARAEHGESRRRSRRALFV